MKNGIIAHAQTILSDRVKQGDLEKGFTVSYEDAERYVIEFLDYYKNRGLREHFIQQVFRPTGDFKHDYPLELHRDRIFPEWAYENDIMNVAHSYIDKSYQYHHIVIHTSSTHPV